MLIVYDAQISLSQIWNKVSHLLREMVTFHAVTLIYSQLSLALNLSIHVGSHLLKTYFWFLRFVRIERISKRILRYIIQFSRFHCEPAVRLSGKCVNIYCGDLLYQKHFSCQPVFLLCLHKVGGDNENRTHDPLLARQVLSQLSYTPKLKTIAIFSMVKVFL